MQIGGRTGRSLPGLLGTARCATDRVTDRVAEQVSVEIVRAPAQTRSASPCPVEIPRPGTIAREGLSLCSGNCNMSGGYAVPSPFESASWAYRPPVADRWRVVSTMVPSWSSGSRDRCRSRSRSRGRGSRPGPRSRPRRNPPDGISLSPGSSRTARGCCAGQRRGQGPVAVRKRHIRPQARAI